MAKLLSAKLFHLQTKIQLTHLLGFQKMKTLIEDKVSF